jgi:hypothetical protein
MRIRQLVNLFAIAIFFAYIFWQPIQRLKRAKLLDEQIRNRRSKLESMLSKSEISGLPNQEIFNSLMQRKEQIESAYRNLRSFISPGKARLPVDAQDPGLYFIEKMHAVTKSLQRKALAKGVKLPASLGFAEELPSKDIIEESLRKLEMVEDMVGALIEEGAEKIVLIKFLKTKDVTLEQSSLLYKELPCQIGLSCDTETLVKFLNRLENSSPIYVLKELHITGAKPPMLEVAAVISGIVLEKSEDSNKQ